MNVSIKISVERVIAIAAGAQVGYWATLDGDVFVERDSGKRLGKLTMPRLRKGLRAMAEAAPRHFADILCGKADSVTGDVLVQFALYGELIFG